MTKWYAALSEAGKTRRFLHKMDKFKDYEDRLNNHHIIDYMIKVPPT